MAISDGTITATYTDVRSMLFSTGSVLDTYQEDGTVEAMSGEGSETCLGSYRLDVERLVARSRGGSVCQCAIITDHKQWVPAYSEARDWFPKRSPVLAR
jgi:hypothetical protein